MSSFVFENHYYRLFANEAAITFYISTYRSVTLPSLLFGKEDECSDKSDNQTFCIGSSATRFRR